MCNPQCIDLQYSSHFIIKMLRYLAIDLGMTSLAGPGREIGEVAIPGDNPSYGTSNDLNKVQSSAEYQEIPAPSGNSSQNGRQLPTGSPEEREFDNPIYGSEEEREFDNPIYATDDTAAQEVESENLYTIPDPPPSDDRHADETIG